MTIPKFTVDLDTRRLKIRNGTYPVKLYVDYNDIPNTYGTIYDMTLEEWQKLKQPHISASLREKRDKLQELEDKAREFARSLEIFSFNRFEQLFIEGNPLIKARKRTNKGGSAPADNFDFTPFLEKVYILKDEDLGKGFILDVFVMKIKDLLQEGSVGTAQVYQAAYYSLKSYWGLKRFGEINVSVIKQYGRSQKEKGNSRSYVGINLRTLRAMFNYADAKGIIDKKKYYPFGRYKYVIARPAKRKKFLTPQQLAGLYFYQTKDDGLQEAVAYWKFLYLGNGMNMKDALLLTWDCCQGNYIVFERAKTELTAKGEQESIDVFISDDLRDILNYLGTKDKSPDNYIFPILNKEMNAIEIHHTIKRVIKLINARMKRVCKELGIPPIATTGLARKAAVNQVLAGGATPHFIKEFLGHENLNTQNHYTDAAADFQKRQMAIQLTQFENVGRPDLFGPSKADA